MADYSNVIIRNIVVFGGTGTQGSPIVHELSKSGKFKVTVPTRDLTSPSSLTLSTFPSVQLILADYTSEAGLRDAFNGQDACYFNLNSFTIGEAHEYFWTFRAYEIAVQSNLKWFVLSGGPDRLKQHGYQEKYRNSHGTVSARLSDWLACQSLEILPWTVLYGGVYAQMLSSMLSPIKRTDGVYEFAAPIGEGSIPFVDVADYGVRTRYVWATWTTTYPELVAAFRNSTGRDAVFRDITQEEWFERLSAYVDPETRMPRDVHADDGTAFTFRQTFGAWWNLWRDNIRDLESERKMGEWSNKVSPGRAKSLEEWMRRTEYTGERIVRFYRGENSADMS
ncbi:NAD(P)-binding protein [Cadophora sp. DSE1049]|nr:NAD(P)-binding protein [Cadophora sp. DSE1049]